MEVTSGVSGASAVAPVKPDFVSRGGIKLQQALDVFGIDVAGRVCADLGCNAGGFVDCLLQRGAARLYAIDTGYGMLDWKLRNDARVIVMERTNAMHVELPEAVDLVSIDVGWTRQKRILPAARRMLGPGGAIVALIKPHYEAEPALLRGGVLPRELVDGVVRRVLEEARGCGLEAIATAVSAIQGSGGNTEVLCRFSVISAAAGT